MRSFGECLAFHLFENGTRPDGKAKLWSRKTFSHAVGREGTGRAVGNWLHNKHLPPRTNDIEQALFGENDTDAYSAWRAELRAAHKAYWQKGSTEPTSPRWTGSPYPGLRRFEPDEAAIFFGRERETEALSELLLDPSARFIAVIGASGTGKSSLISAGVLPALAARGHQWPDLSFTPGFAGDNPFLALAIELAKRLDQPIKPGVLAQRLASAPASISQHARRILKGYPDDSALVLFVDQFEELFKDAAEQYKQSFVELIVAAAGDGDLRTIVTLREDFFGAFANQPSLAKLVQQGRSIFPLGVPNYSTLEKMIRGPAELAGLTVDEELIDQLMADAGPTPGEALPLVAFCLEELYRHVHPREHLANEDYAALGGLRGAIGKRLAEILDGLGLDKIQLTASLEQIFPLVVQVDAAGKTVRRWAPRRAFASYAEPVPQIAETLIENGLLFARRSETDEVITLRHEALIQEWADLHNWVVANASFLRRMHSLLLLLQSPKDQAHAVHSLVAMADESCSLIVGELTNIMRDADAGVRGAAAIALGRIGQPAAHAVRALVEALRDADERVRSAAAKALGGIRPASAEEVAALAGAVPALMDALRDADKDVREAAVLVLRAIGQASAETVPALVEALRDAEHDVRSAAAVGLVFSASGEAVAALVEALRDANKNVRSVAAKALDCIGSAAAVGVPALMDALRDDDQDVRSAAAKVLGRIGPASAEAVPALVNALRDDAPRIRSDVAQRRWAGSARPLRRSSPRWWTRSAMPMLA